MVARGEAFHTQQVVTPAQATEIPKARTELVSAVLPPARVELPGSDRRNPFVFPPPEPIPQIFPRAVGRLGSLAPQDHAVALTHSS